jgi:hypothetical protein
MNYTPNDLLPTASGIRIFIAEQPYQTITSKTPEIQQAASSAEVHAFVLLDPLYKDGAVTGYVESICRMKSGCQQGTANGNVAVAPFFALFI